MQSCNAWKFVSTVNRNWIISQSYHIAATFLFLTYFPKAGLGDLPICVSHNIAARQLSLLFEEWSDRPFEVWSLAEQGAGLLSLSLALRRRMNIVYWTSTWFVDRSEGRTLCIEPTRLLFSDRYNIKIFSCFRNTLSEQSSRPTSSPPSSQMETIWIST